MSQLLVLLLKCATASALAAPTYSLWSGAVKGGGARTVGMAGAMTGLADDYYGALDNPAGLALTVGGLDLKISSAGIEDTLQTDPGKSFRYYTTGLALPLEAWGAGLGYAVPFEATAPSGERIRLSEVRLSLAKALFGHRLALGFGLAPTQLESAGTRSTRLLMNFGALYRFPRRLFLGIAYTPAATFDGDPLGRTFALPHQLSLGGAWIPNRFFRGALSLRYIADEPAETFRFHRPTERVGRSGAVQAHLGFDYRFLSLKRIYARLFAGSYVESTRAGESARVHVSWGIEVQPWFFNITAGMDAASGYRNTTFGLGIDVAEILRKLRLYPAEVQAPPGGFLPSPFEVSDDWLPRHLQDNPEEAFQTIGPELEDYRKSMKRIPDNLDWRGLLPD